MPLSTTARLEALVRCTVRRRGGVAYNGRNGMIDATGHLAPPNRTARHGRTLP